MADRAALVKGVVLASTSPWRRDLLASTGVEFSVAAADVDESQIQHAEPGTLAILRARAKASAVAAASPGQLVIGADQTLSIDGDMLRKAKDESEARAQLSRLAGRTHWLHSAFSLSYAESPQSTPRNLHAEVIDVAMSMRALSEPEISALVATGDWRGSVGSYKIERSGVHLFAKAAADSSAIVGLPLCELLAALRRLGINPLLAPKPPWTIKVEPA